MHHLSYPNNSSGHKCLENMENILKWFSKHVCAVLKKGSHIHLGWYKGETFFIFGGAIPLRSLLFIRHSRFKGGKRDFFYCSCCYSSKKRHLFCRLVLLKIHAKDYMPFQIRLTKTNLNSKLNMADCLNTVWILYIQIIIFRLLRKNALVH